MKPSSFVADFDSATAMLRALARYLNGKDFPLLGMASKTRAGALEAAATWSIARHPGCASKYTSGADGSKPSIRAGYAMPIWI
jgi:hypothetical protein